jgi:pantothenate kinase type III
MPYKAELHTIITDWWQFAVFVGGAFIAFVVGKERQRFKVDQIGREVEAQGERIKALEKQGTAEAVQLAQIVTSQGHILRTLDEIKQALGGKADK